LSRGDRSKEPSPLRSLLAGAATRFGLDDGAAVGSVWGKWNDIVGPDVAAHAEPTSLRSGVLRVRADSPVWAHEIGYLAEEIKSRVNALLDRAAVEEVRIWSGPSKTPGRAAPGARDATADTTRDGPEKPAPDDPLGALERAREAWAARRRTEG